MFKTLALVESPLWTHCIIKILRRTFSRFVNARLPRSIFAFSHDMFGKMEAQPLQVLTIDIWQNHVGLVHKKDQGVATAGENVSEMWNIPIEFHPPVPNIQQLTPVDIEFATSILPQTMDQ